MFINIFLSPRQSLKSLTAEDSLVFPAVIVSAAGLIGIAVFGAPTSPAYGQWLEYLDRGPALALLFWLLSASVIHVSARLLGGTASWRQTMITTGFSATPWLLMVLFLPLVLWVSASARDLSVLNQIMIWPKRIGIIWTSCLALFGLSEYHQFIRPRPWLNALFSIALFPVCVLLAVLAIIICLAVSMLL